MYGVRVYITPEDIINKLCDEDRAKFNQCMFIDVERSFSDGSITIDCILFNDKDRYIKGDMHRQKLYVDGKDTTLSVFYPRVDTKR